jgi:UDP-N-acetylmuramyl pentapeptide synthase
MLELGDEKNKFHEEIIALSKELQLQGIFVGKLFSNIAKKDKNIISFPTIKEAEEFLQTAQPKKNLILLKGSRGIQLEKLTDVL